MQVERLVVTLLADATRYNRIMDATTARLTAFATYAGTVLGKTALQLAANYERAGIAFEVMTGNAMQGQKVLQDVTKLSLETPFSADELIKSAKQVKAFGFETDDIIPILSRLGDVSSATGTDMDRIILAFGQVRTTGRLMGQELRQFTNAGVPILENLAKVMGVSVAQVPNLVRQGKVGFSDVANAFNLMTNEGGLFHNMMQRINKETLSGRWANFKENVQNAARNLGLAAIEGLNLKGVLTSMSGGMNVNMGRAKAFFSDLRKGFQIVGFLVDKLWKNLKDLWKSIVEGAGVVKKWASDNSLLVNSLLAAIAYFAAFKLLVIGLTTVWGILVAAWALGGTVLLALSTPLGLAVLGLTALIAALTELGAFDGLGKIMGDGFAAMGETFSKTWKGIKDAVAGGDLQLAWDVGLAGLEVAWEQLLVTMEAAWVKFSANLYGRLIKSPADWLERQMVSVEFALRRVANEANPDALAKINEEERVRLATMETMKAVRNQKDLEAANAEAKKLMDGIKNTPAAQKFSELLGRSELTKFVGKELAGQMGVIANAAFAPRPGADKVVLPGAIGDLRPGLPEKFDDDVWGRALAAHFDEVNKQLFTEMVLSVGRVNHMLHERRVGLVPWTDQDITDAANKAKELQGKFKALQEWFTKTAAQGGGVANIKTPLGIRPEVLTFARDLQKEFNKGIGPLEQYRGALEDLNEALMGPLAQLGLAGRNIGLAMEAGLGMTPFGALGGTELFKGIINGRENDFGIFRAFEKLRNGTNVDRSGGAGAAQMYGSREAQETINRSNAQMLTVEQQVLQTLMDANYLHKQSVAYQAQVVEAVKKIERDPVMQMKIGGVE